jgi:hypothetical protein
MLDQAALIIGGGLLAAFWTGTNAVFTGSKQTNEVRDRVALGKIGGDSLPNDYRWLLLWVDWLPMKLALAAVSLMLGVIIVMLPGLAGAVSVARGFSVICNVASIVPFGGALTFLVSGLVELRFLWRTIQARGTAVRQGRGS